jgi:Pentapeptide repeats (8 copies)
MSRDYSQKNLRKASFKDENLSYVRFNNSDLRGADFSGSDLTGAVFTHVKTGITPKNTVLIFFAALLISLLSGYVAMLAGNTVQVMLNSRDPNLRLAGWITLGLSLAFILFSYWKGLGTAISQLIIPVVVTGLLLGGVFYITGLGTGKGMLYQVLALLLLVVMFIVGTVARAAAGVLSQVLFLVVALCGGMFGKSLGGGIGTVIMAVSCALISKRALSGAKGFDGLRKVACFITSRFGTSFRNTRLQNAMFNQSEISNADFTDTDVSMVAWNDSRRINCLIDDNWSKNAGDGNHK